ncbi:tyrosine-type recombinase/integrase [Micromonospora sp. WMMD1076]|uniref:tyrosine-type recombinase/integrase n=1 Tax=Micromonospora sp. WMMD1076 TaxID=3016103 RepID=UPI00249B8F7A|nr:site-specific integrase [Micromonospora sp. WMMD1076]WFF08073.1 tyrosine-type recombinase/integrase [Micromonospora sp. WMMD1076]
MSDPAHGSWYFSVQLPRDTPGPARFRKGGFRTARQAATARDHALATAVAGTNPRRITVEQWLRRWQQSLPGRVRRSTAATYGHHVDYYRIPYLGNHTLTGLRPAHIETMFTTIGALPTRSGRPVSAATVQRIRATLRRALNMAIREQLLLVNPARLILLPRPHRHRPQPWSAARVAAWRHDGQRPTVSGWTPDQLARFLTFTADDPLYPLWWLASLRGLRRGELCALRWTDLDLIEGTLTVNHHIAHVHGRPYLDSPKTAAGHRTIALDRTTVTVLRQHQQHQQQFFSDARKPWQPDGPVFTRPIRPDWLTHHFTARVTASGLPPVRLHDLRHGAATLALTAHTDLKTVQDMLGHTSYAFTADTYTTVLPEQARQAAETTAQIILNAQHKLPRTKPG